MIVFLLFVNTNKKSKENRIRAIKKKQNKINFGLFPGNWNNCNC